MKSGVWLDIQLSNDGDYPWRITIHAEALRETWRSSNGYAFTPDVTKTGLYRFDSPYIQELYNAVNECNTVHKWKPPKRKFTKPLELDVQLTGDPKWPLSICVVCKDPVDFISSDGFRLKTGSVECGYETMSYTFVPNHALKYQGIDGVWWFKVKQAIDEYNQQHNQHVEDTMKNASDVVSDVVSNVKQGMKIAGAKKLGARVTEIVKKQLGKQYPAFFATPTGQMLEPVIVPLMVHAALLILSDSQPMAKKASKVSALAVQGSSMSLSDGLGELLNPLLPELFALLPLIESEESEE